MVLGTRQLDCTGKHEIREQDLGKAQEFCDFELDCKTGEDPMGEQWEVFHSACSL
jgi:hypothetical protein